MKVSYQWLGEYVDLTGISASDLAEKLTHSGIEVDVIEKRNKGVQHVVVGKVISCEQHPDADKLSVCIVDVGQPEHLQIVCGAKNVAAGQKVPVALVGAVLPGDFKIKKAKLRGVESHGMICSAKELGMNDRLLPKEYQEGILVLPDDTPIGASILDILALNDEVLELDLTPNRSDCLSMIGTAYEIAAILNKEVQLPQVEDFEDPTVEAKDHIKVKISSKEYCNHYAARLIENVQIKPSPLWMQNKLLAAGIRPINNIVDITNYVMLEYGQPLHAFDADRLHEGNIDVRLAQPGETIVTLDGVERTLEPHMLLITDGKKPVALAGVMGGANSEVTETTTRILLESASFSGSSVRKTARQLGMRSEASLRFEKEANPDAVIPALNRAAALMVQYAGGRVAKGIVEDKGEIKQNRTISISAEKVNQYLGTNISMEEIKSIFSRLQFTFTETSHNSLDVTVPLRRGDISRDVDLIEEIARLYGYDRIPTTLISGTTTPGSLDRNQWIRREIRRLLTASGLHEVVNYSFTHPDKIKAHPGLFPEAIPISLSMPMSEERSVLRTSLIPHLIDNAVYNRNRNIDDLAVFEIGYVFITQEKQLTQLPDEDMMLAMLLCGHRQRTHWSGQSEKVDFYDLKGIIEKILNYLGIHEVNYVAKPLEGLHPGRTAMLEIATPEGTVPLGYMGQLHPRVQQAHELDDTYVLEIRLAPLFELANFDITYRTLPRYPSIVRDMAIVVDQDVQAGDIINQVQKTAGALLESVEMFDLYVGERLGANKKSIAFSLIYRHEERTLTDDEVNELHAKVVRSLEETFGAALRQ